MEKRKDKEEAAAVSWKKKIWIVMVVVCVATLAGSAFNIWRTVRQSRHENDTFLELVRMVERVPEESGEKGSTESAVSGEGGAVSRSSAKESQIGRAHV